MITERTPAEAIRTIRTAEFEGADAFLLDLRKLERRFHTKDDLAPILLSTDRPVMVYYYRREITDFEPVSDEVRAQSFIVAAEAGASAIDMMGDFFDPTDTELTTDADAIRKQRDLIAEVRSHGTEVMASSHTLVPMSTEEVLDHIQGLLAVEPDMIKIVPRVATESDLLEAMKTTVALRDNLDVPFIHIAMGEYNRIHRIVGPMLGSAVCFCVVYYRDDSILEQPLLRATRQVFDNIVWQTPRSVLEAIAYEIKP